MAKCRLGPKKVKRIEQMTGKKVRSAFVRGGWDHYWAEVFFEGEEYTLDNPPSMVNYKTGEIDGEPNAIISKLRMVRDHLNKNENGGN